MSSLGIDHQYSNLNEINGVVEEQPASSQSCLQNPKRNGGRYCRNESDYRRGCSNGVTVGTSHNTFIGYDRWSGYSRYSSYSFSLSYCFRIQRR